jgi:enediyne biosynthesis protein E4
MRVFSSFGSAHDPRLLIGVGKADLVSKVIVRWPSGAVSELRHLATKRAYTVVEPKSVVRESKREQ